MQSNNIVMMSSPVKNHATRKAIVDGYLVFWLECTQSKDSLQSIYLMNK